MDTEFFRRVINQSAFETAIEPELKNYQYNRWREADIKAKRQIFLLDIYLEKHSNSDKAKKNINYWKSKI